MHNPLRDRILNRTRFVRRRARYALLDALDAIRGRRDPLTPPRSLYFTTGDADYRSVGAEFLGHFTGLAGLAPGERVLDVGCGVGRMAVPLTRFLSRDGSYEGFDIVPRWTRWCRQAITSRYPNFDFQTADIHNRFYNPAGRCAASEYRFPYPDASFDFAFATSVFTHMPLPEVVSYISETARVLKRGGRCLLTFYLINAESLRLIEEGNSQLKFSIMGDFYTTNPRMPEDCIGYDEERILALFARSGLRVRPPVRYGSWSGRSDPVSYQDIVVADRS